MVNIKIIDQISDETNSTLDSKHPDHQDRWLSDDQVYSLCLEKGIN